MDTSPFHAGELQAQALAGVGSRGAGIRDLMPDQHRIFFAQLPYLFVAGLDAEGWPVATVLTGAPGFVQSPDARTLRIAALPDPNDPAAGAFGAGRPIGILGLDFATRRRNRANGTIASLDRDGFGIAIEESFGNCPQYIQTRMVQAAATAPARAEQFERLRPDARAMIEAADTFFIGSHARDVGGVDVSHRGGRPGFVRVDGDVLTIPDFSGNRYFNTFGNLLVEPRAALLFVDFERGDVLQLQGSAEIIWNGDEVRALEGAERLLRFRVERGWRRPAALPLRWAFGSFAPTTERTGVWRGHSENTV